jgi:two-component system OmpR family response regulator
VGRGSVFHFTLPKRLRPPRRHILFVDDDKFARKMLRAVLENAGYEVSAAGDGDTALELARGQSVDLAIVDLCLPGMPGPVLMRELRNIKGDLPLLLYTGHPDSELMTQAMELTPLTLLTKTCTKEKLFEAVRALLERRGDGETRKSEVGSEEETRKSEGGRRK